LDPIFTTTEPFETESNATELPNTKLTSTGFSKARINPAKPFADQSLETSSLPAEPAQDRYHDIKQK
jgi:hypothetical protein